MAQYHRTSLRAVASRVAPGDTITDSVLIAAEPGTPIFDGVKGLTFERCKFIRCVPPSDARQTDCRSSQGPLPDETSLDEPADISKRDIAEFVADVRDGKADVQAFRTRHNLALRTRVVSGGTS
ncbi:MAG: hypothetical protein GY794_08870 [bacterium]|nr:hypothetical protein [bacterium]